MGIEERIKMLRLDLGLNQTDFAQKTNISRSMVAAIELGTREVKDIHIAQICSAFNVSETWLRTGEGSMYNENDATLIDQLCKAYNLDSYGREMLEVFVELPNEQRRIFLDFFHTFVTPRTHKDDDAESTEILDHIDDNNEKETRA